MQQMPYPRGSMTGAYTTSHSSSSSSSYHRATRRPLKTYLFSLLLGISLLWLLFVLFSRGADLTSRSGNPDVVLVTTLDSQLSSTHQANIIENRRAYAARHGYASFVVNASDYDLLSGTPASWAQVPAMRHAMALYPNCAWVWYLSATALIMEPGKSLRERVLTPSVLEGLMIENQPVVPPDSVIRTFSGTRAGRIDVILSQDAEGLAGSSIVVRSGAFARFFLDAWFDPLYRNYNFQKAEAHALEHMVQWHATVLARLALVPQRVINSYTRETGAGAGAGLYQEGDFVANFQGCTADPARNCDEEMRPLVARWRALREREREWR